MVGGFSTVDVLEDAWIYDVHLDEWRLIDALQVNGPQAYRGYVSH